jgi:hypothetical protein
MWAEMLQWKEMAESYIYPVTGRKAGKGKATLVQCPRRTRLPDFKTVGTCRW